MISVLIIRTGMCTRVALDFAAYPVIFGRQYREVLTLAAHRENFTIREKPVESRLDDQKKFDRMGILISQGEFLRLF